MFSFTLPAISGSLVLLAIRIVVALAFLASARNKFRDIKHFATTDGLPLPLAYFVACAEAAGGLGLITGVLAQWAALGLMLLMCGTIGIHILKWHSPYWASKGGWEYDLMLLVLSAVILVYGPGMIVLFQ